MGYDIHDPQHVWVRQIELLDGEEAPGALICVAEYAGNEQRYIPVSAQKLAEERRMKGRLRRVDAKREEIVEEARPQLEHQQVVQLDMPSDRVPDPAFATVAEAEVLSFEPAPKPASSLAPTSASRNPAGDPDIDLAWDIVEAPADYQIPHGHLRLMNALMGNPAFLDMLREVGLPLADLADRLAAAHAPLKSSNER